MTWFVFLTMSLASYRLTRLVVRDTFPPVLWARDRLVGGWRGLTDREQHDLAVLRGKPQYIELRKTWQVDAEGEQRYVYRWNHVPFWLAELLSCPWCASAYVSGGVVAAVDVLHGLPVPVLQGLAVWAVAAVLASRTEL